ncbi:ADP-ribosylglycohydrolase family protein [Bacillus sp. FJAT-27251]|uniref:ADP-ribosylglycohydrolase family protein n=1 Tax=Bacillus sp. FJAT-27251 TaxID=1684142 RepID=UPI0006A7C520|nr:ADP-ribosylglycohydrolase family protein [Bacillus sp. FJAT-27251]
MLNKIKGALFGFAIGDALGATTEFMTKGEIEEQYGKVTGMMGGGWLDLEKGEITDDTAMTLAVVKGIIRDRKEPVEPIGDEFLKWYDSRPKDVGIIISTVLANFDGDWLGTAKRAHYDWLGGKSAGNGTLMRCLPVALAYRDLDQMLDITRQQSQMTHYDSLADEACVLYNWIAFRVLGGQLLKDAIKEEIKETRYELSPTGGQPDCPPDGFVVHTMHWVLYWLLHSDSYLDVVIGAANEGGDSDTIAAIAGGLAGLECGFDQLPGEYVQDLLGKEELLEIAQGLHSLYQA